MVSARETLGASPSISRLLSTNWVWTLSPDSMSRIFSSRVPKRLSTPLPIRTLAFIEWVLETSIIGNKRDRKRHSDGRDPDLRQPACAGSSIPSGKHYTSSVKPPVRHKSGRRRDPSTRGLASERRWYARLAAFLWGSLVSCGRLSIGQQPLLQRTAAVDGAPSGSRAGCQPAPHHASDSTLMSCTPPDM